MLKDFSSRVLRLNPIKREANSFQYPMLMEQLQSKMGTILYRGGQQQRILCRGISESWTPKCGKVFWESQRWSTRKRDMQLTVKMLLEITKNTWHTLSVFGCITEEECQTLYFPDIDSSCCSLENIKDLVIVQSFHTNRCLASEKRDKAEK